jgi:MFS family permease
MGNSLANNSTGNVNYSLNKDDFSKIIESTSGIFLLFYYIVLIISFIYIFNLKITEYNYIDHDGKLINYTKTVQFFESLTLNSPLNILSKRIFELNIENKKYNYIGLSIYSYIIIILTFIIAFIMLLNGLLKNFIFSIVTNIIQANPNNNPYNNHDCVTKITENPYGLIIGNYFIIVGLSLVFLLPFLIGYLTYFLGFDSYDIKKSYWFNYVVLLLVFSPVIVIFVLRKTIAKRLDVFPDIYKFISKKDYPYVDFLNKSFNFNFSTIAVYLLIFISFLYLIYIYSNFQILNMKYKIIAYFIIFFTLFIFIPVFLLFFCYLNICSAQNSLNNLDSNNSLQTDDEAGQNEVNYINGTNNSVSSLYQLLVKYNYPCFMKN